VGRLPFRRDNTPELIASVTGCIVGGVHDAGGVAEGSSGCGASARAGSATDLAVEVCGLVRVDDLNDFQLDARRQHLIRPPATTKQNGIG
jgi:hypothetical protein